MSNKKEKTNEFFGCTFFGGNFPLDNLMASLLGGVAGGLGNIATNAIYGHSTMITPKKEGLLIKIFVRSTSQSFELKSADILQLESSLITKRGRAILRTTLSFILWLIGLVLVFGILSNSLGFLDKYKLMNWLFLFILFAIPLIGAFITFRKNWKPLERLKIVLKEGKHLIFEINSKDISNAHKILESSGYIIGS